jgi:hypothetical protein
MECISASNQEGKETITKRKKQSEKSEERETQEKQRGVTTYLE